MNQTFNLKRFLSLFKKHTADNYKTYLMSFMVLLGFLFFGMGFVAYVSGGKILAKTQVGFFIFAFLIAGLIFTSITFSDLGNRKKAIAILTLPASHFEKYLVGWIYSFILFQLIFIPAFYLVAMIINQMTPANLGDNGQLVLDLLSDDNKVYIVFYIYTMLHAICLLGSVFFEKHQFIKTAFLLFIAIFTIVFLNLEFTRAIIPSFVHSAVPFGDLLVLRPEKGELIPINLLKEPNLYMSATLLVIVIILWASSFYRLKEKQV